jgi:hypothetical protein
MEALLFSLTFRPKPLRLEFVRLLLGKSITKHFPPRTEAKKF